MYGSSIIINFAYTLLLAEAPPGSTREGLKKHLKKLKALDRWSQGLSDYIKGRDYWIAVSGATEVSERRFASQPSADAPRTAASLSFSSDRMI